MLLRWKLYWAALVSAMLGFSFWINWRRYKQEGWKAVAAMSLAETTLLAILAVFCPPLLIALCVMYLADKLASSAVWKTVVSVLAAISLGAMANLFLEGVLIIGSLAMGLITGSFRKHWKLRGQPPQERPSSNFGRAA